MSPALAAARRRPRHLTLAVSTLGVALGPRWPAGVLLVGLAGVTLARDPRWAVVISLAALGGGLAGAARMGAVPTPPPALLGHAVSGTAEVLSATARSPWGGWRATVRMGGRVGGAQLLLIAPAGSPEPPAGEGALLMVRGGLRALRLNESYLRARGVTAAVDADAVVDTGRLRGGPLGLVDAVRRRMQSVLTTGIPPPEGALLLGMVLGDASRLPAADATALRDAGLTHLVAASGANIALLVAFVLALGAAGGLPLRWRLVASLVAIAGYVPLAGGGPSIQRAGVMGVAALAAILAGRPAARWYALLLAAAVTLLLTPGALDDAGWQMSFAAVAAIMAGAGPLRRTLTRRRWPGPLADAFAVTLTATLASAPLILWHFGRLSPLTVPANLLAVPAAAPVMWLGVAAGFVGEVAAGPAHLLAKAAAVPAAFILQVGRLTAQAQQVIPAGAMIAVAVGLAAALAVLFTGRAVDSSRRGARRRVSVAAGVAAAALAALIAAAAPPSPPVPDAFQVAFLDVGQGDATLIRHGSVAVLVDSGPPDGHVVDRLHMLGVRRLAALVITHAQADHDGGAAAVLGAMPVGALIDGRDGVRDVPGVQAAAAAAHRHVRRLIPVAGQQITIGPMVMRILSPVAEDPAAHLGQDPNARAVVALVQDGETRMLLTADAESDVTAALPVGHIDILKVAHHGSVDEGLGAQLGFLRPRVAGIEVGAHNTYGHPAPATMATLHRAVPVVVRTDRDGTVLVTRAASRLVVRRHIG